MPFKISSSQASGGAAKSLVLERASLRALLPARQPVALQDCSVLVSDVSLLQSVARYPEELED